VPAVPASRVNREAVFNTDRGTSITILAACMHPHPVCTTYECSFCEQSVICDEFCLLVVSEIAFVAYLAADMPHWKDDTACAERCLTIDSLRKSRGGSAKELPKTRVRTVQPTDNRLC
jgi:hypothetical protein